MIEEFVGQLRKELASGLPGLEAQMQMAPARLSDIKRDFKHKEPPRESAVLILFYEAQGKIHFPLMVRPIYPGVHSGQISFPGGKFELTDYNLEETALRETEEEIGIPREQVKVVGQLSAHYIPPSNFNIEPYIGYLKEKPVFVKDEKEVDEVLEVRLDDLLDENLRKSKLIRPYQGVEIKAPYFDIQDKVVWGATAMILSELIEVIKQTPYIHE
ncbi:NUDIX hydrolase [Reichenbachiella ulvae]|uniref:CoA pyrophosphatase n=1 Tax=Reichenbachiella ulvae TaxID=2980104 RepID=A0ABT3CS97_9BACT|nr:CoA pyrophosphatase [Reichenbachiella ulvae]MCV9386570.1 CoA pyrophosphatase [Reichenbachiella ulvae]